MSYADDLAKDRDKFRTQRNRLAGAIRDVLDEHSGTSSSRDTPAMKSARKLLREIDASDPIVNAVEQLSR